MNGLMEAWVRLGRAGQNAMEVARFGGLETGGEPAPFEIVTETPMYKLRRYLRDGSDRPAIVLVPPMMLSAEVYDISEATSAVRILDDMGLDPWVVDFGAPEHEEGGLERSMTDHVLAVSDAIDVVRAETGRDVHLSGYSQGGMFCYVAAAYRRSDGIASLITYGSAVDMGSQIPEGISEQNFVDALDFLADNVLARMSVPAWLSRFGFRMLDPIRSIRDQLAFILQLHDRDALLPREDERRFLQQEGWVAWSGPAVAELVRQLVMSNRMLSGGWVVEDRLVTLADLDCPILSFVGSKDSIAPPPTVQAIVRAAPRAELYETVVDKGHFGLVVGSGAVGVTWPTVDAWVDWVEGDGELPDNVTPLTEDPGADDQSQLEQLLGLTANVVISSGRTAVSSARRGLKTATALATGAFDQLPRLSRLDQTRPTTRVSLGSVMAEQARDAPDDTVFLFEHRGHTYGAANERVDNVVRGLLSLGVRRGEHVGVLMDTRPSALGVVIALNRLGAVAVMLRPDGDLAREVDLGAVTRIVADPEHGDDAAGLDGVKVHVLGGGGGPRDLGSAVDDMEAIDPDAVEVPAWYEPNPGQARDLAFILFSGTGERTRVNRVTNGRWALSAFGTATSAALTRADTLLSLTPIHHSSALLVGVGAAIASRARLAMVRRYDPESFWDDIRRNGVTAVTYTWTQIGDLLEQPRRIEENHHPIRVFIGSGMPTGQWRRVERRWAPARVLEFYASTQAGAVLVNLSDKVGSLGRPLPGASEVRVARYDLDAGRLVEGPDGFVQPCDVGEVGMLLARIRSAEAAGNDRSLRSLFEKGDAWLATGDLVRVDADGDHWLVGGTESLIRTADAVVAPIPVQDVLSECDAVHLACVYGVESPRGGTVAAAAVSLRDGAEMTAARLDECLGRLEFDQRPMYVRIVDEVPRTTWYRVRTGPLRREGIPAGEELFVRQKNGYRWRTP